MSPSRFTCCPCAQNCCDRQESPSRLEAQAHWKALFTESCFSFKLHVFSPNLLDKKQCIHCSTVYTTLKYFFTNRYQYITGIIFQSTEIFSINTCSYVLEDFCLIFFQPWHRNNNHTLRRPSQQCYYIGNVITSREGKLPVQISRNIVP